MLELLKRWSELEGDRCRDFTRARYLIEFGGDGENEENHLTRSHLCQKDFAVIDRAVRCAITAHKLIYRLETDSDGKCYVSILDPASGASWRAIDGESAIGLLTAYLEYLESVQSQEVR